MRVSPKTLALTGVTAVLLAGAVVAAGGQSGGGAPLQTERLLLENSRVRVLEYTSRPTGGVCGYGRHSHPAHLTIIMDPARDRMFVGDGKPEEADLKPGDVFWSDGETHTDVNIGSTNSRIIVVELK